ncbi:hypothetical protein BSZ35_19210 [Salinibacter sp. 10B]|nr:hypothetical protein BSZ35_19210 [Salinibacter sp. 10B]
MDATEPFPDRLFRLPLPDALIAEMPEMTDSALRAILALIRLSFRFDPNEGRNGRWVCPDRTFSRAGIQEACGLSGQGVRNGLGELEEAGYVTIDRSGRSYEHALEIAVPERRFTYVPTALLETASSLSGTELRFVLAVLRATWGWTTDSTEENEMPKHQRWAQLSMAALARLTGRSETAVKEAARCLNGTWFQRRRPTHGAYYYRFRTDVLTTESDPDRETSTPEKLAVKQKRTAVFSMGIPNDLAPDRQRSAPPRRGTIEKSLENSAKHSARSKRAKHGPKNPPSSNGGSAVHGGERSSGDSSRRPAQTPHPEEAHPKRGSHRGAAGNHQAKSGKIDLTDFSEQKRQLGQKLANAGVWPSSIPELLARHSAQRIEANFELFRERAPSVKNQGAFLRAAIEEGYALPSPSSCPSETGEKTSAEDHARRDEADGRSIADATALPQPGTKVSEAKKQQLIEEGLATEADFEKFADYDDPTELQHFFRVEKVPSPTVR